MINFMQFVAIIAAIFAISRAFLRQRDKELNIKGFLFWTAIWIAVVAIAFVPQVANKISESLGVRSGLNLAVYLSIMLLFYLVFRMYVMIEKTEQEITTLTREIAKKR